jgi:hypothetical protein
MECSMTTGKIHFRNATEQLSWLFVFAITLGWLAFLFFQRGHPFDEAEHAHVSWLISQGKKPLDDFFQHHQPLLWSALALYYRAGFTGAGVLIWGRVLVILSGIVSIFSLWTLGSGVPTKSSLYGGPQTISTPIQWRILSYLGAAIFIGLTGFLPELFVVRPETIATGLILLALVIWRSEASAFSIVVAGALAGAAAYATPRFVLLGGLFVLIGRSSVRRWLLLATGAALFVGAYTTLSGFGIDKVLFSLRFSSYLQSVGDGVAGRREITWIRLLFVTGLPLGALAFLVPKAEHARALALLGYAVIVFAACNRLAGLFRYAQAYAPFIVAVAVAAAWIGGRLAWPRQPLLALGTVTAAMVILPGFLSFKPTRPQLDFLASVRARDRLASLVPPSGTILVFTKDNPITIEDASYYGIPLSDGSDRLCRAVRGFQSSGNNISGLRLPECNFLKALENARPYLVDRSITGSTTDAARAEQIIVKNYLPVALGNRFPAYLQEDVERRVDSAPSGQ